ncbi:tRNA (adenosine(37)-N6)-threonylcarbamoyltransferase complex dimerization subunit type 1 TsaB [Novosphingobium umbonatum]|uniref:tRNA (adenosine(37)-N6)-threonylcarbamoyltransferase complex dimerization subunit type 1 TsaB n=1 Tax=Novosphingobium umbonatum TaxID=1908524 RepID=UPI001FEABFA6|nr:tRNA (adenosine(37)-N6)-threonylcarbamoyltransferase complex dimerization subunit type 1 TsaB [Novosphingobium umbonatum]
MSETSKPVLNEGRWLAIDATTQACSVALFEQGALVAGDYRLLGRGHAEALVPMIAGLPDQGRADGIVAGLGPGSFTGVRIGLAAARALGVAWGVPVLGYPTLSLIAAMAQARQAGEVLIATTGGHGEWFTQSFDAMGAASSALQSLPPAQAAELAPEHVAGNEAEALVAKRGFGSATPLWPDAHEVLHLPQACYTQDLSPLYGRAPDARLPGGRLPSAA